MNAKKRAIPAWTGEPFFSSKSHVLSWGYPRVDGGTPILGITSGAHYCVR